MILIDPIITIKATDVSDDCKAVELTLTADEKDNTTFGSQWKTTEAALKGGTVRLSFKQGFGSGTIDATISLADLGDTVTITVQPAAGATSATNPEFTFDAVVTTLTPIGGAVGDVLTNDVTWTITGPVTKATS